MSVLIIGILIPADESKEVTSVNIDRDDYKEIQRLVGGPLGLLHE